MLCRKHHTPPGIYVETPHASGDATGEAQFARWIKEEKHAFADAVALAARPQANPLRNGQVFAGDGATKRILDVEGDGDCLHCLGASGWMIRDRPYSAQENGAGSARNHRQSDCSRWPYRRSEW